MATVDLKDAARQQRLRGTDTEILRRLVEQTLHGTRDSDRHATALFGICLGSNGRNFLELGVRHGATTLPMLYAASLLGGTLTSVDIKDVNVSLDPEMSKSWRFHNGDAVEFLRALPDEARFDVVYVDDWHAYPHVAQELALLDRHVTPRGVILLHDLMYGDSGPHYHCDLTLADGQWAAGGPYRAVGELNPQIWEFATLPWCSGLTLLRKKYSTLY